jgi:hypothetical protein
MTDMAARIAESEGAEILELARAVIAAPTPPSVRRRRVAIVPVLRSDAEKAGGEEIVRRTIEAVAPPDDPALRAKAADVIAALKGIAPRTPVESGLAGLFVAMERAAFDCLAIARISVFGQGRVSLWEGRGKQGATAAPMAPKLETLP